MNFLSLSLSQIRARSWPKQSLDPGKNQLLLLLLRGLDRGGDAPAVDATGEVDRELYPATEATVFDAANGSAVASPAPRTAVIRLPGPDPFAGAIKGECFLLMAAE